MVNDLRFPKPPFTPVSPRIARNPESHTSHPAGVWHAMRYAETPPHTAQCMWRGRNLKYLVYLVYVSANREDASRVGAPPRRAATHLGAAFDRSPALSSLHSGGLSTQRSRTAKVGKYRLPPHGFNLRGTRRNKCAHTVCTALRTVAARCDPSNSAFETARFSRNTEHALLPVTVLHRL